MPLSAQKTNIDEAWLGLNGEQDLITKTGTQSLLVRWVHRRSRGNSDRQRTSRRKRQKNKPGRKQNRAGTPWPLNWLCTGPKQRNGGSRNQRQRKKIGNRNSGGGILPRTNSAEAGTSCQIEGAKQNQVLVVKRCRVEENQNRLKKK
jgi:hypothetical protein